MCRDTLLLCGMILSLRPVIVLSFIFASAALAQNALPADPRKPDPLVLKIVSEMSQEIRQRVHAVLVKSRISEARIAEVILEVLSAEWPPPALLRDSA